MCNSNDNYRPREVFWVFMAAIAWGMILVFNVQFYISQGDKLYKRSQEERTLKEN